MYVWRLYWLVLPRCGSIRPRRRLERVFHTPAPSSILLPTSIMVTSTILHSPIGCCRRKRWRRRAHIQSASPILHLPETRSLFSARAMMMMMCMWGTKRRVKQTITKSPAAISDFFPNPIYLSVHYQCVGDCSFGGRCVVVWSLSLQAKVPGQKPRSDACTSMGPLN